MKRALTIFTGLCRFGMTHLLSGLLPLYVVTEYPRSGGTWFSNMVSEYLRLPFPRNRLPALRSCVMHGHYLFSPTIRNVFVVLRDGRDAMVSFYFHSFFKNELDNHHLVERMRRRLPFDDFDDVERNLPRFIEYKFTERRPPRFTWSEFVNSWADRDVAFVRYERLVEDGISEFSKALAKLTGHQPDARRVGEIVQGHAFRNRAGRDPGQEARSSFLRKGIPGDWRNYFNKAAREIFHHYAGRELIRLGYEKDASWV